MTLCENPLYRLGENDHWTALHVHTAQHIVTTQSIVAMGPGNYH